MAYRNRLFWQATKIELKALIRYMGIKLQMLITGVRVLCVCVREYTNYIENIETVRENRTGLLWQDILELNTAITMN